MVRGHFNLQDSFLNQVRRENVPVTIYLVNGVQIRGYVRGFDSFTVVVENENGRQLLIYKHALSTVVPQEPVPLLARGAPPAPAGTEAVPEAGRDAPTADAETADR